MSEPHAIDRLRTLNPTTSLVWASPSVVNRVREVVSAELPLGRPGQHLPMNIDTFVVVGGGKLIDRAKIAARTAERSITLIAIPSIWGSGAEASPVAVLDQEGCKTIKLDEKYRPDEVLYWPELAESIPVPLARAACGDAWSHAFEGFLSPLASTELRAEVACLIRELLEVPIGADPRWFRLSSRACNAQARSSVGLAHGLAHTLESELRTSEPQQGWGHAKLCSLFLLPVFRLNGHASERQQELFDEYQLSASQLEQVFCQLFDAECYRLALPVLKSSWTHVLKDRCTRTNCSLVRRDYLSFFTDFRLSNDDGPA